MWDNDSYGYKVEGAAFYMKATCRPRNHDLPLLKGYDLAHYPISTVSKLDTKDKKKGRAVIDIWKSNHLVLLNIYSLFFQS